MWRRGGNPDSHRTTGQRRQGNGSAAVLRCIALTIGMLGWSAMAGSQELTPLMPYQEHQKKIRSAQEIEPLTSELFGDSISLYNGATEFSVVDIDLPGNNGRGFATAASVGWRRSGDNWGCHPYQAIELQR